MWQNAKSWWTRHFRGGEQLVFMTPLCCFFHGTCVPLLKPGSSLENLDSPTFIVILFDAQEWSVFRFERLRGALTPALSQRARGQEGRGVAHLPALPSILHPANSGSTG